MQNPIIKILQIYLISSSHVSLRITCNILINSQFENAHISYAAVQVSGAEIPYTRNSFPLSANLYWRWTKWITWRKEGSCLRIQCHSKARLLFSWQQILHSTTLHIQFVTIRTLDAWLSSCYMLSRWFPVWLFCDPEDGGDMFLRNIGMTFNSWTVTLLPSPLWNVQ
jgi:hypothetical protein